MDFLSSNIKILRREYNYTQASLAELLGVKPQQVGNYEVGKSNVTVDILLKLSNIFGITTDKLCKHDLNSKEQVLQISNTKDERKVTIEEKIKETYADPKLPDYESVNTSKLLSESKKHLPEDIYSNLQTLCNQFESLKERNLDLTEGFLQYRELDRKTREAFRQLGYNVPPIKDDPKKH